MKKILIMIIFIVSLSLNNVYSYTLSENDINTINSITKKIESLINKNWESYRSKYIKILNRLSIKYKKDEKLKAIIDKIFISIDKRFATQINQLLKNGYTIKEIDNPNLVLPSDINSEQIQKYFSIGDIRFALVLQSSSNVWLWLFSTYNTKHFVGVLVAKKGDTKWTKLLEIKDPENPNYGIEINGSKNYPPLNNPYYLMIDNQRLLLTVVDATGYSSEGNIKVFALTKWNDWKLEKCYYYDAEELYNAKLDGGDEFIYSTKFSKHKLQAIESCNNVQLFSKE